MRKFSKKIIIMALLFSVALPVFGAYRQSYAADGSLLNKSGCTQFPEERGFLGLLPWYAGLCTDDTGKNVRIPECTQNDTTECNNLKFTIWQIVFNVLQDLSVIAAYLTVGFVIYGGYQYLLARGSTEKALNGKKTIITSFIGLAITMLASVIFGVIKFAMTKGVVDDTGTIEVDGLVVTGIPNIDANVALTNTISWVIGIAGIVAAIFLVYGGGVYVSSRGEPQKIETAKKTIIYSVIGLFIVGVAQVSIAMVTANLRGARDDAIKKARDRAQEQVLIIANKE